jgi:hypothetical protein
MSSIKLNFINNSSDTNNSQVVVFQKNAATDVDELAVAWKVITNCQQGWSHPFNFPSEIYVSVSDSWGNYSPLLPAMPGQSFSVSEGPSGDTLSLAGDAPKPTDIDVVNNLLAGAVSANIFSNGRLLALKTNIAPGEKAEFAFNPSLWIGAVSQIEEGDVMNAAILSSVNTELSLAGVQSADIVMTGGGPGPESTPFRFSLENVVQA